MLRVELAWTPRHIIVIITSSSNHIIGSRNRGQIDETVGGVVLLVACVLMIRCLTKAVCVSTVER